MTDNQRERSGQLGLDDNSFPLELDTRECENILNDIVDLDGYFFLATFLEHRAEAFNYLASTVARTNDGTQGCTRFVEIWPFIRKPSQSRIGIYYNSRERLFELMGDRGRKFTDGRNAVHMRQLVIDGVNTLLQSLAGGNVNDCREHHRALVGFDRVEPNLDGKLAAVLL
jgi:hypothetical protein